jgi:hypothetical protein
MHLIPDHDEIAVIELQFLLLHKQQDFFLQHKQTLSHDYGYHLSLIIM